MRKPTLIAPALITGALLALTPLTAQAGGPKGCPPGLAKKSPACVPPGQAGQMYRHGHVYQRGERLVGDYIVIEYPGRYGLDPNQSYYRLGDYVYRVDRDTKEVLDLIGAVAAVLN